MNNDNHPQCRCIRKIAKKQHISEEQAARWWCEKCAEKWRNTMDLENHMVMNLNRDLDRIFGEPTPEEVAADRQRIEDEIDSMWLDESMVGEAISECPEFNAFHKFLLEGDTAAAGAVIRVGIGRYFRSIAEGS